MLCVATISSEKLIIVKELYYKKFYSVNDIAKDFGVSIHAVYYFMRRHKLKRRNLIKSNRAAFQKKPLSFSIKKTLSESEQRLKIAAVMLYWGEGYKTERASGIDFANSDPEMLVFFVNFLRLICKVDESRLRILMYCYSNQDLKKLITFWSKKLQISKKQFIKPYVKESADKKSKNKMQYGLVHIRYNDKKLLILMLEWIEKYKKIYASVTEWPNVEGCKPSGHRPTGVRIPPGALDEKEG